MAFRDIGPLRRADEGLNHQIVDTFATVRESDLSWTEKIWTSIARSMGRSSSTSASGSITTAGSSTASAASRAVASSGRSARAASWTSAPEDVAVGPVSYEILEALDPVRVRLEPSAVQPVSFDVVLSGVTPPFFEERNLVRNRQTGRIDVDVIRYHQGGWASGTLTVDGETHELRPRSGSDSAITRGVSVKASACRPSICHRGHRPPDRPSRGLMKWTPSFFPAAGRHLLRPRCS